MDITLKEYRDKVLGCWYGKCIGGTLGAPFECYKGVVELNGYIQDMKDGGAPNDDLDLQCVWLMAAEEYGRKVNSHVLGEYWLNYIVPDWSEYGACKNNLSMGLLPSVSGWYHNHNRDSNGCFILSEIWACLAPGQPELAVRLALEDAVVGHSDEGVYAELFCAAMESAAFVESDYNKLIDIGLSYLPADCGIARAAALIRKLYAEGKTWRQARVALLNEIPSSFGAYMGLHPMSEPDPDVKNGDLGYDAPANIGLMLLGMLYGEGDFGRSICIAAGCCEDADCTAGTLSALMGIVLGAEKLPQEWIRPIGDNIRTCCIDLTTGVQIPADVHQLTDRVSALMPAFMVGKFDLYEGKITVKEKDELFCQFSEKDRQELYGVMPRGIRMENPLFTATLNCEDGINFQPGKPMHFSLFVRNSVMHQQWLECRWILPEGWSSQTGKEFSMNLDQAHGGYATLEAQLCLTPEEFEGGRAECVLEITSHGHPTRMYFPLTLVRNPQTLIR